MHTKIYEEMHDSLPPLQQSNSFKHKQNSRKKNKTKEEKIRIKMYDFDLVIITYKHITSSYLRMKNLLFQSKGRILSWTT